jgi:hypothetical protein
MNNNYLIIFKNRLSRLLNSVGTDNIYYTSRLYLSYARHWSGAPNQTLLTKQDTRLITRQPHTLPFTHNSFLRLPANHLMATRPRTFLHPIVNQYRFLPDIVYASVGARADQANVLISQLVFFIWSKQEAHFVH